MKCVLIFLLALVGYGLGYHMKVLTSRRLSVKGQLKMSTTAPNSVARQVLAVEKLTKTYTDKPQFEKISFSLTEGGCIGLIGANGEGKSTLLKCLAKANNPSPNQYFHYNQHACSEFMFEEGKIDMINEGKLIFVEQETNLVENYAYELLFYGKSNEMKSLRDYYQYKANAYPANAVVNEDLLLEEVVMTGGWELEQEALELLQNINFNKELLLSKVKSLSGGERKKLSIISALLQKPTILLLDEPTNHLDFVALDWLVDYLNEKCQREKALSVICVTHDRYFLQNVCTEILELEYGELVRYPGNYSRYLELKEQRESAVSAENNRLQIKLQREKEWMVKQPRGRQAKSRVRQERFYELRDLTTRRLDQARKKETSGVKLELNPNSKETPRLGGIVLDFIDASYYFHRNNVGKNSEDDDDGVPLLRDFSYSFQKHDRVGIVGANGVGKSTFLQLIAGVLPLSEGSVIVGETARIGYYSQNGLSLTKEEEQMTVLQYLQEVIASSSQLAADRAKTISEQQNTIQMTAVEEKLGRRKRLQNKEIRPQVLISSGAQDSGYTGITEVEARRWLRNFNFDNRKVMNRVGQLSGGERRRLQLISVLALKPNLILLDEPTNDLDLKTLLALEEFLLNEFKGALIVISHDQYFLSKLTNHLFIFEGQGRVQDFTGTCAEYIDYCKDQQRKSSYNVHDQGNHGNERSSSSSSSSNIKAKSLPLTTTTMETPQTLAPLNFQERKEMGKIEREMKKLGSQLQALEAEMLAKSQDFETQKNQKALAEITELNKQIIQLQEDFKVKEEKWLAFAERDSTL